jgi:hypothetical protein
MIAVLFFNAIEMLYLWAGFDEGTLQQRFLCRSSAGFGLNHGGVIELTLPENRSETEHAA